MTHFVFSDGATIPSIGLGTWQLTGSPCVEQVSAALREGYRHIDTAEIYGNESEIGRALQDTDVRRRELFITSKVWTAHLSYEGVLSALRNSLAELQVEYLDLYLVHWPKKGTNYESVFRAMKKAQNQDLIKSIGVSNFTVEHLKKVIPIANSVGVDIVTNQVEYHPYLNQERLRVFCEEHDIRLTAYSPLARGDVLDDSVLSRVAKRKGVGVAPVVLRWLLQKGLIAIPKSSNLAHAKENLVAWDIELSEDEIEKIDDIDKQKRYINPGFAEF